MIGYKLHTNKRRNHRNMEEGQLPLHNLFVSDLVEALTRTGRMRILSNKVRISRLARDELYKAIATGWRPDIDVVGVIIANHRRDGFCDYR